MARARQGRRAVKKPLYKKWWFWVVIVIVLLVVVFASAGSSDGNTTGQAENQPTESAEYGQTSEGVSADQFVEEVKTAIQGAISSKTEAITDVVLKDGDLCVYVDFSNADPSPLTLEDLALARTSSITDAILELTDYDSLWETITVDFGEIGHITNNKADVENSGFGRYFPGEGLTLE